MNPEPSANNGERPGDPEGDALPWWDWLLLPLGLPCALLFVACFGSLAALSIPVIAVLAATQRSQERQFLNQMRGRGRFADWPELEPRLSSGEGTLIIEQAQKRMVRVWWTDEHVADLAPIAAPPKEELDYLQFWAPHPFTLWCFERYLHPESGQAVMTNPPYPYPPGFVEADFFSSRFPRARVIMTIRQA